ncbi:MAG: hypothetical protein ACI4TF_09635 [Oliverpabstia sp.]
MAYRIDERDFQNITRIYEDLAETCVRGLERFYQDIIDLSLKTTYEPLVLFTNRIYDFYMGEFREHLKSEFQNWYDSRYSLHALINAIRGGNDAYQLAMRYMDDIESDLDSLFRLSASPVKCDTSEPMIEEQDFETFTAAIRDYVQTAQGARDDAVSRTQQMASDNDAFVCIIPYVKTTGDSMIESFNSMITEVQEGLGLFSGGVSVTVDESEGQRTKVYETRLPWDSNLTFL